jgi:hypothetical protein
MWQVRLLDKVAYRIAVEALDAFERGNARLLAPLVLRCLAQLRSEESASRNRLYEESNECFAERLEKAMAGGDRMELPGIVFACTAMPDYQSTLVESEEDSPNLVEFGDHDAWLYSVLCRVAPGFDRWWTDLCQHRTERYAEGLSMFLLRREDMVHLQEALHKVVEGPSSPPALGKVRDRFLDLIARSLADDRTTIAVSDVG